MKTFEFESKTVRKILSKEYKLPELWCGNKHNEFIKTRSNNYNLYRDKWINIPKKFEVLEFPMHISIDTNGLCNLLCPMCPRRTNPNISLNKNDLNNVVSFGVYKKIINECSENGLMSLRLNKQNEPLLTKNLNEYISYAKKKGIIDIMINTNATLLTNKTCVNLINSGLDILKISIDSHRKEEYEASRIGAKFEDTYKKVKNFFNLREKMNGNTPLIRISKITKKSENQQLKEYIEFWKPFCDEIVFSYCADFSASGQMFDTQKIKKLDVINEIGLCPQPWQRLEIDYKGNVFPCCNERNELIIGNIFKQSIKDIWKNKKINTLRNMIQKSNIFSKTECKDCYAYQYFNL